MDGAGRNLESFDESDGGHHVQDRRRGHAGRVADAVMVLQIFGVIVASMFEMAEERGHSYERQDKTDFLHLLHDDIISRDAVPLPQNVQLLPGLQ